MTRLFIIILALTVVACKKQQVAAFSSTPGIAFYSAGASDSTLYSFAYALQPKEKDTVYIDMRLFGPVSQFPRAISVKAVEGTTAKEGVDFLLPDTSLPAGAVTMRYPVVLYNTPALEAGVFRIKLQVMPGKDLAVGATGLEKGGTYARDSYLIYVTSLLEKPSYWASVESRFGTFSKVKFRFMVSILGITDFSSAAIGTYGYYNYPITLKNALAEYEAVNGPLLDENQVRVTF